MSEKKPTLNRRTNDDGSHSHWEVIDSEGAILFTEDVENCFMDKHHAESCYLIPKPPIGSAKEWMEQDALYHDDDKMNVTFSEMCVYMDEYAQSFATAHQPPISEERINEFNKRLDEIFNEGEPTIARILDAYIKSSPPTIAGITDDEIYDKAREICTIDLKDGNEPIISGLEVSKCIRMAEWIRDKALTPKGEEWTQERVQKAIKELGFEFPQNDEQLKAWNEKFKDYPYKANPNNIDPVKILNSINREHKGNESGFLCLKEPPCSEQCDECESADSH